MFETVEHGMRDRFRQTAEILKYINKLEETTAGENLDFIKIQKGYLFVSMYSTIEFTLTSTVSRFLELLNSDPRKPMEYKK